MKAWTTFEGSTILRLLSGRCNVFAVVAGGGFLLVDTGKASRRAALYRGIDGLLRAGNRFAALLLTHAHFDHAGNAAAVAERYHVPVYSAGNEIDFLALGMNPPIRGVMGLAQLVNRIPPERAARLLRYPPVSGAKALIPGAMASLGFPGVSALPTPGHTAGSFSFIVDNQFALVGDAMHGVFPGNARPPFAQDEAGLLIGWRKLLESGCGLFFPAHGLPRKRDLVLKQYGTLTGQLPAFANSGKTI